MEHTRCEAWWALSFSRRAWSRSLSYSRSTSSLSAERRADGRVNWVRFYYYEPWCCCRRLQSASASAMRPRLKRLPRPPSLSIGIAIVPLRFAVLRKGNWVSIRGRGRRVDAFAGHELDWTGSCFNNASKARQLTCSVKKAAQPTRPLICAYILPCVPRDIIRCVLETHQKS